MRLDCALRKVEPLGDLRVRTAGGHQRNDLALTMREGRAIKTLAKWTRNRDLPQRDSSHRSTQDSLAVALEHQGVGAGNQQGSRVTSGGSGHHDHDSCVWQSLPYCMNDVPRTLRVVIHDEDDVGAVGELLDGGWPGT